jgi:HEPN superfamily AbiU2-like protein
VTTLTPEAEFERELDIFRAESESAIQFFYSWQAVNAVASTDKSVRRALNRTPLFWNTSLGALQAATLVALGRVFDPEQKNHNVSRLLALAHANLDIFSKVALAGRKKKLGSNADEWLSEYLRTVYVPTSEDIRRLKRYVSARRRIYEASYRDLRHKLFAHRAVSDRAAIGALFAKTNIRELQQLLVFLVRLHEALWQLFFNGIKPTLRPTRYSVKRMLEQPSPHATDAKVQERLVHEAGRMLKSLARDA